MRRKIRYKLPILGSDTLWAMFLRSEPSDEIGIGSCAAIISTLQDVYETMGQFEKKVMVDFVL